MSITNLLTSSILNASSFRNLALLICHLFIDGTFRTSHLLYDPDCFDDNVLVEIQSICPQPIPWKLTNIYGYSLLPWEYQVDTEDNVLQLLFFKPKDLMGQINYFKIYFNFFQIFVLPHTDEIETKEQYSIIRDFVFKSDANALIVYYDRSDSEVFVNWLPINNYNDYQSDWQPKRMSTDPQTNLIDCTDIFERTFGEYDRRRSIEINGVCRTPNNKSRCVLPLYESIRMSYYHQQLPKSYINVMFAYDFYPFVPWGNEILIQNQSAANKGLKFHNIPINDEEQ